MSESKGNKNWILKKRILWKNFLYSEIIKRHVEEYNSDLIDELKNIREEMLKECEHKENNFLIVVGLALDAFNLLVQGREKQYPIEEKIIFYQNPQFFNFNNEENIKYYKRLLEISHKYNVLATDLLYPFDMCSIITKYNDDFIPPKTFLFDNRVNQDYVICKVNDTLIYDRIMPYQLTKQNIDYLNFQLLTNKILIGENLTDDEIKDYYRLSDDTSIGKFNTYSIKKYLFGLLAWDAAKLGKKNSLANNIYARCQKLDKKCGDINCDNFNNPDCPSQPTCSKFMQEVRQAVSNSIKERQLLGSKINKPKVNPTVVHDLTRYKLDSLCTIPTKL